MRECAILWFLSKHSVTLQLFGRDSVWREPALDSAEFSCGTDDVLAVDDMAVFVLRPSGPCSRTCCSLPS